MSKPILAISSTSNLAVQAGKSMALLGGNAVDGAISAALVSLITEPGVVALGGGGYVTLWPSNGEPITLDGYMAVPGLGSGRVPDPTQMRSAVMDYGGGVTTLVGHSSVCTPGALKALEMACLEFGSLDWATVMQPAIRIAHTGFPLSHASYNYLIHAHEAIFSQCDASRRALYNSSGGLLKPGETVFVEDLADSLEMIAQQGTQVFYEGELAHRIIEDMRQNQGSLNAQDLGEYQVKRRSSICFELDHWKMASNPPPAVGGVTLGAMLLMMQSPELSHWDQSTLRKMIHAQQYVLGYRRDHLDVSDNLEAQTKKLLHSVHRMTPGAPSTVHTSSVDNGGLACSITLSAGYGSGIIAKDTGIWLNNSLGELELNRKNPAMLKSGKRMLSNMAPTIARNGDGTTLAIGSPGADRITTAIVQTLVNHLLMGMDLDEAIRHPRLHLEWTNSKPRIAFEDGLVLPDDVELATRPIPGLSMFFGGVGAVSFSPDRGFSAATDPRRTGEALIV